MWFVWYYRNNGRSATEIREAYRPKLSPEDVVNHQNI